MDNMKVVMIGAGSASFTAGLVADLLASKMADSYTVALCDIDQRALDVAHGLTRRMVEHLDAPVTLEASLDRCDLLPGADAVVTTIAVGGRRGWELDVTVPREHGIHQPVADTVMAGGISRALRQIPPMLDIANDVHWLAPGAVFFNYANPMAAICRAVNKATPQRLIGLCHGVQGTHRYLASFLDVPVEETAILYCGMNHLTFITHFARHGKDLWPQVRAKLQASPPEDDRFSWELFETYGAFPAVLDRHVTEFFPERFPGGNYYGKILGVDFWNILEVVDGGDKRYAKMAAMADGAEPLEEGLLQRTLGEHESLIPILESVFADRQQLFPMNAPNETVAGIPAGFVLEMPTIATRAGCVPLAMPPLSPGVLAVVNEALYGVEITVEAALTGCYDTFVQALLFDRCVTDLAAARKLADALLAAHKEHLPRFA
jgi:alpha-galactosidase